MSTPHSYFMLHQKCKDHIPSLRFVVHSFWTRCTTTCTTDPQQIEVMEFEPNIPPINVTAPTSSY